jgi:hypothetical protein
MSRSKEKPSHGGQAQHQATAPGTPSEQTPETTTSAAWIQRRLIAELVEDMHHGTGIGGGGVDALVARDRDGRPVIWASYVEGVLRDAARRLRGRDVAESFFGRRGGQGQRAVFTSLYTTEDPTCRVWRSTARAAFDNRAPKDDTLRAVEFVPRGTRFEGVVELPMDDLALLQRLVAEACRWPSIGERRPAAARHPTLTRHG